MPNTVYEEYDRPDIATDVPCLPPIMNLEFPPLSQQTGFECVTMPACNPADLIVLEKVTPTPPGQEEIKVEKDLSQLLPETEAMINYGTRQVRHLNAVTLELKLLLEYEQKILQQVMTRIDKFKSLRDENKRKSTEWEEGYKAKMPELDSYSTKLVNVPHSQVISVEGVPGPVQQKILFQIVSRTINNANRIVVQLSMEEAVANDIDLTLSDLKKHCTVMLKQIQTWLRILNTQECSQNIVLERWNESSNTIKNLKAKGDAVSLGHESTGMGLSHQMKPYEERLRRIEAAICRLCGPPCGTCPEVPDQGSSSGHGQNLDQGSSSGQGQNLDQGSSSGPGGQSRGQLSFPDLDQFSQTLHRHTGGNHGQYRDNGGSPPYDPIRVGDPGSPGDPCVSPQSFNAGSGGYMEDTYFTQFVGGPAYLDLTPPGPECSPVINPPQPQVICPPGGGASPETSDYFGILRSPPPASGWGSPACIEAMEYDDQGALRRNRAPPGTYPDIDLVDTPGIGYPVPKAALERGGRPLGHCTPLSPTSPPPRQMGRFRPLAASSPEGKKSGQLRPRQLPVCPPQHPMAGQPVNPALLPKIQEDLKRLADKNRNLHDLVNNFKQIRATLTDEIDKAVRLNQKLQRDLYYVAGVQGQ